MPTVLVVDDVADNVELLACLLEDNGYEILKAFDGATALEMAESGNPDVIMLDIMMPGIDGIEVCQRLKADAALRSIPVILVSALHEDADLIRGLYAGAYDYLIKPINATIAMARVRAAERSKETEQSLREREQRFQAVFNQTSQFMVLLDPQGIVLEVNWTATALVGVDRELIVGRSFWEGPWWKASPRAREQHRAAVADAAGGRIVNYEGEYAGKGGAPVDVDFSLMPVTDEENTVVLLLMVGHDITVRKRAQVAMREAKEAAEAASRAKSEFLANISHEIRTPMNAILGMTRLTLETDLSPEQKENLQVVSSATDSLLSIINDVLDFSKMETGKLELDHVEFGLRNQMRDILASLDPRARAKGLDLSYRIHPDVPDQLNGDPTRLRQIIVNLVGNAIKFTECGHVVVDVDLDSKAGAAVGLHVRVTDTGIGVPADKQEAIFAAFTQADGSATRLYGGIGLGLAISSQLVRLMGGRVWIDTAVGQGSVFHFTAQLATTSALPRAKDASMVDHRDVRVPVSSLPSPRSLRILVAEDNPFNQRVASLMLAKLGHVATIAPNGLEAVAALGRQSFDLVFMDLQMPLMDGMQATTAIRLAEAGTARHIPIIALSAHAMKEYRGRCLDAGMDGYVSKPIQEEKLRHAIEECVSWIGEPATSKRMDMKTGSPMDVATALARVDDDRGFFGEMAAMFLDESPRLLAQIRAAVEACDPAALAGPAHTMKNWTGNFVAQAALDAVRLLEALGHDDNLANAGAAVATLEREIERLRGPMAEFDQSRKRASQIRPDSPGAEIRR